MTQARGKNAAPAGQAAAVKAPKAPPPHTGPTIAFITTCKARLHHIKQTLPTMVAQQADEVIVVDYSCPNGTGDWVAANYPSVKVVRIAGETGFNPSRARNAGAAAATSEWLFFIDADIRMAQNMGASLRRGLKPGAFYRPQYLPGHNAGEAYGSFCVRREDFAAVGGFDEVIEGWGFEDQDLYNRLKLRVPEQRYPIDLLDVISHDDDERHIRSDMRDRWQNEAVNACYAQAKLAISLHRGQGGNMPLDERHKLIGHIRQVVAKWYADGASAPLPMRFKVAELRPHRLASDIWAHCDTAVTVVLDSRRMLKGKPHSRDRRPQAPPRP